jgi:hypothetical protein
MAEYTMELLEPIKIMKEACDMCRRTKAVRVINQKTLEQTKITL